MSELRQEIQAVTAADRLWTAAMEAGGRLGCHQRADRSFFVFGRQFPVCARCTGVLLGEAAVFISRRLSGKLTFWKCAAFMLIMLTDHTVQTLGRESTNIRRLLTGILAGAAVGKAYGTVIKMLTEKS